MHRLKKNSFQGPIDRYFLDEFHDINHPTKIIYHVP